MHWCSRARPLDRCYVARAIDCQFWFRFSSIGSSVNTDDMHTDFITKIKRRYFVRNGSTVGDALSRDDLDITISQKKRVPSKKKRCLWIFPTLELCNKILKQTIRRQRSSSSSTASSSLLLWIFLFPRQVSFCVCAPRRRIHSYETPHDCSLYPNWLKSNYSLTLCPRHWSWWPTTVGSARESICQ